MKIGTCYKENFVVSESIYRNFLETFSDKSPIHTDNDFAKERGFEAFLMHGFILNGFISFFVGMCLPLDLVCQSQTIKFHNPFFLNEKLTLNAEIADFFESVKTFEIKFFFNNDQSQLIAKGVLKVVMI